MKSKLISQFVGYYYDKLYAVKNSTLREADGKNNIKVVVLARKHYIERNVYLPITIKKEVKAAVDFEIESLANEFFVFYKLSTPVEGKTRVTFWQVPKEIIPSFAYIVLPETYLFSQFIVPHQLLDIKALPKAENVYIANSDKGIHSNVNIGQNKQFFCHAAGLSIDTEESIGPDDFVENLCKLLQQHFFKWATGFWLSRRSEKQSIFEKIKPYLLPCSIITMIYLMASSAYLSFQLNRTQDFVESRKADIDAVLTVQREMNDLQDEIVSYQSVGENKQPLWRVWQILSPLYEQGVMFKFIRFNGEYVFFSATYSSASNVLEHMLNEPLARQAEFTTAVRKNGDEESFILRFKLASAGGNDET